ncbi:hypothetical protein BVG19_g2311 [[Candida] boidinii]|nr:hypothetical protein BVG19_g2311 [[Candida] boidinii]OWB48893.1 hypothetical protein B5S27_g430 [[Candida] boidinii]OWB82189.1 hypothetical protein B5S33_g811 [[Candida] boidinii]
MSQIRHIFSRVLNNQWHITTLINLRHHTGRSATTKVDLGIRYFQSSVPKSTNGNKELINETGDVKDEVSHSTVQNVNETSKTITDSSNSSDSIKVFTDADKQHDSITKQKPKGSIPRSNKMPSRPTISENDIEEKFIKGGSGKGGQKINKTNSKVQLTYIPTGLVVTSQATRSRDQNRKIARQILAAKVEEMEKGENSRTAIVIKRKQMVKARAKRKTKAKYKKLAEKENDNAASVLESGNEIEGGLEDEGDDIAVIIEEDEFDDPVKTKN